MGTRTTRANTVAFAGLLSSEAAAQQISLARETATDTPSMLVVPEEKEKVFRRHNLKHAQNDLEDMYYRHEGRRIFKWHHYLAIYDRYFHAFRKAAERNKHRKNAEVAPYGKLRILEIGVQNGGSMQLWRRYFGKNAIVFGIDIDARCKEFEENNCKVRIGDQSNSSFLKSVVEEMEGIDIVIDDGSHIASHQLASFKTLFPLLSFGGLYICEDLHTAYWDGWEGGLKRKGTFVEISKSIIDHMHEWYASAPSELSDLSLRDSVLAISFYDSIVVIEKGKKVRPYAVAVGTPSL